MLQNVTPHKYVSPRGRVWEGGRGAAFRGGGRARFRAAAAVDAGSRRGCDGFEAVAAAQVLRLGRCQFPRRGDAEATSAGASWSGVAGGVRGLHLSPCLWGGLGDFGARRVAMVTA